MLIWWNSVSRQIHISSNLRSNYSPGLKDFLSLLPNQSAFPQDSIHCQNKIEVLEAHSLLLSIVMDGRQLWFSISLTVFSIIKQPLGTKMYMIWNRFFTRTQTDMDIERLEIHRGCIHSHVVIQMQKSFHTESTHSTDLQFHPLCDMCITNVLARGDAKGRCYRELTCCSCN